MSVYKGTRESASWGGTGHDHVITLSEQPIYGSSRIGMRLGNGLEVKRINFPLSGDPQVVSSGDFTCTDLGQLISANISSEGAFITGAKAMPGISASLKAIAEDTYSLSLFTDNANPYGNLEYKLLQDNTNPVWEGETATTGTWSTTLTAGAETSDYQLAIREKSAIFDQPIARHINGKQYEITDHLGNVRVAIGAGLRYDPDLELFTPRIIATNTYYPFGMLIEPLSGNSEGYRYGFNGMEKDDDVKSNGNWYTFGDYGYDPRVVQRPAPDPKWRNYPSQSPYAVLMGNPIRYIDIDGQEPIDPRTGKPIPKFNLYRAAVYDPNYIDQTKLKIVEDNDLYSNANPWIKRERGKPDGAWEGAAYHIHENVWEHTSTGASDGLRQITGKKGGSDYGAPNDAIWRNVAKKGSYIFVDDRYAESEWLFINQSEYNVTTVEENYITQIVNLTRPDDNSKFNINSVTSFDIQKGDIQTRQVSTWWGGARTEKYRTLSVTETTQQYENNEATGSSTTKTYTREEILE